MRSVPEGEVTARSRTRAALGTAISQTLRRERIAMRSDQYAARLAGFMFLFLMATVASSSILLSHGNQMG